MTDFPLLEWSEEQQRYVAMHHPFTSPKDEDIDKLESDPGAVRAKAYDIVLNGVEIGGGSIRIHSAELQRRMFAALGFTPEQAQARFGLPARRVPLRPAAARRAWPTGLTGWPCSSAGRRTSAT